MDHRLLEILVCPICKGALKHHRSGRAASGSEARAELWCVGDRLAYPIVDGIPRMLVDEARKLDDSELAG